MASVDLYEGKVDGHDDSHTRPVHAVDIVSETDFLPLARRVRKKFSALTTDFVGPDGERDTMWNLASTMGKMISAYERQVGIGHGALDNVTVTAEGPHTASDAFTPAAQLSAASSLYQESAAAEEGSSIDNLIDFEWGGIDEMLWNQVLQDFTMNP